MCFSTTASFGASAILAVAGIATLRKVETPAQIMFASIPVMFSIQQFTEGFVWIALKDPHSNDWQSIPINIFLLLAQVVWPVWVPLSILLIEKNDKRKKGLKILLGVGAVLSLFLAYRMLFSSVSAAITPYHIRYEIDFPYRQYFVIIFASYFLATIVPPFISSGKRMISLGLLNFASFLITILFFKDYLISVWCFFSALISWEVYLVMKDMAAKPQLFASERPSNDAYQPLT